jgi:hypothetical protein
VGRRSREERGGYQQRFHRCDSSSLIADVA